MLLMLLPACSRAKNKDKPVTQTIVPNKLTTPTNFILDSIQLQILLTKFAVTNNAKQEVLHFYLDRNYEFAWINNDGLTTAASTFYQQMQSDSKALHEKGFTNKLLDSLYTQVTDNDKQFLADTNKIKQIEILLTASFFMYANKIYGGYTTNSKSLNWYIPRTKKNYQSFLDSLVSLQKNETLQEPINEYYTRLKQKLLLFRAIEKNGGYPIITTKKILSITDNDSAIIAIKKYLFIVGHLKINDTTSVFTDSLASAVKLYQQQMGIAITAKIDTSTLAEFNKPIAYRIKQIMINMERLRWVPVNMEKDYLLVNIPEFALHLFQNYKQVWATKIVVGKAIKPTSIFRDEVSQIIINPYWNVPTSIAQKEILPHIRRNKNYLSNNNMEVVSQHPFVVRQKPGNNNALGRIKFLFPNHYNIYLHDTPSKNLFTQTTRAFSHGCIRVQQPFTLAQYLLKNNSRYTTAFIDSILQTNREYSIKLRPTLPVYIAYFTAWVDNTGQINFRKDLYNLDDKLAKEIFE